MMERPIVAAGRLVGKCGPAPATVNKGLAHMVRLGIVRETSGQRRTRLFSYRRYVEMLNGEMSL